MPRVKIAGSRTHRMPPVSSRGPWSGASLCALRDGESVDTYFFREAGENRSDTGEGLRVVRVGTHAPKAGGSTTLSADCPRTGVSWAAVGGNHRGSIFRLIVGTAIFIWLGLDFKCKTSLQILTGTKHEGEGLAGTPFANIELAIVKIVTRVTATELETKIGRFEKLIGPVDHQGGNLRKLVITNGSGCT